MDYSGHISTSEIGNLKITHEVNLFRNRLFLEFLVSKNKFQFTECYCFIIKDSNRIVTKQIKLFQFHCVREKILKNQQNLKSIKILCQVNQEILKPLKVIVAAGKLILRYAYSLRGISAGILQICQSRGHSAKILLTI